MFAASPARGWLLGALLAAGLQVRDGRDAIAAALRAPAAVGYEVRGRLALQIEQTRLDVEASVLQRRAAGGEGPWTRVEARLVPGQGEPREVVLVGDGMGWTFLDRTARTAVVAADLAGAGPLAERVGGLALEPFVADEPLAGDGWSDGGEVEFAGALAASWTHADGASEATWLFDALTHWPVRVERRYPVDAVETALDWLRVEQVRVDPPLEGRFDRAVPAGFETRPARPAPPSEPETVPDPTRLASLAPLREAFDGARGKVRLVGLFAPT